RIDHHGVAGALVRFEGRGAGGDIVIHAAFARGQRPAHIVGRDGWATAAAGGEEAGMPGPVTRRCDRALARWRRTFAWAATRAAGRRATSTGRRAHDRPRCTGSARRWGCAAAARGRDTI